MTIQEQLAVVKLQSVWKSTNAIYLKLDAITQEEADMNLAEFIEYADQVMEDVEKSMKEHRNLWVKDHLSK
tara:strand:+ start:1593 stop:1805 length:213 start_codon:yes stop_codon:yes gene_type:complete